MPSDIRRGKNEDVGAVMAVAALNAPLLEELTRSQLDMHWEQSSWKSQKEWDQWPQKEWSQKEWDQWRIKKEAMTTCVSSGASMTPVVAIIPLAKAAQGVNVVSPDYEAHMDGAGSVLPTLKNHRPYSGPHVSWNDTEHWTNRCWYCLQLTQPAHTKIHCPEYIADIAHFLQCGKYENVVSPDYEALMDGTAMVLPTLKNR